MFMVKTTQKVKTKTSSAKQRLLMLAAAAVLGISFVISPLAIADQFDEQIKQLQADNSQKKATVNQLQIQAESYQGEIDRLQGEINVIQQQIRENEAKRDDLQNQITAAEVELAKQKKMLSENLKAVYVEGHIMYAGNAGFQQRPQRVFG